ncbi:MAG: FAD-dependent oxidoreductase [Clostridia bacterium]|nr:FAD-dependent oxidoreductase [Clostridia bacterium]
MGFELNLNLGTAKSRKVETGIIYDTLIVGGGPAGLNAALYAKRKGLNVGVITEKVGGQVLNTYLVENYLGYKSITGEELMAKFEEHVKEYDVPVTTEEKVVRILNNEYKEIHTSNGNVYLAKTVILASGTIPRMLDVPGEKEFYSKGVSYCAICDGSLYQQGVVIVAGGGNSAVGTAIDMARIAKKVKLVHRSEFRADKILLDKLYALTNVEIFLQTKIEEIQGKSRMTNIVALDKKTNKHIVIEAEGIFIEIGHIPKTECLHGMIDLDDKGEIIVNSKAETNIPGIYAAGDVAQGEYKQIIISAAEGAKAALSANEYINEGKH